MKTTLVSQAGFTLIEAMIAMLVLAFGLLAVAGFQTTLAHNSDVAKQRAEATRLAQAKIEDLRSFEQVVTETGKVAFADIVTGADGRNTGTALPASVTNADYMRVWTVTTPTASQKILRVTVDWVDRQGLPQSITLSSMISAANPSDSGALAIAGADPLTRKPTYGMPAIPTVGKHLGGGKSAIQLPGGTQYIVFNAATGAVIERCTGTVDASLTTTCGSEFDARLVTGFLSGLTIPLPDTFDSNAQAEATGVTLVPIPPATAQPHECFVTRVPLDGNHPREPGSSPTGFASGFYSYFCLIEPLPDGTWSGSLQVIALAGSLMQTDDRICRLSWDQGDSGTTIGDSNAEHPDPYLNVTESPLEAQNFRYVPRLGPGAPGSCPPPETPLPPGIAVTYSSVNLIP